MRKIKILSFFILACFFAAFIVRAYTSVGEVNGVMNNVNTIKAQTTGLTEEDTLEAQLFIDLRIKDLKEESVRWNDCDVVTGDSILLLPTSAHCFLPRENRPLTFLEKTYKTLNFPITCVIAALCIAVLVLFVIVMLSFFRTKVFDHQNVKHMHSIGVSLLVVGVLDTLWHALELYLASQAFHSASFAVDYRNVCAWTPLMSGLVVLLMCEVLRHATNIKQEQDLTI